jgi:SNF2 family DNA or RNA helicase
MASLHLQDVGVGVQWDKGTLEVLHAHNEQQRILDEQLSLEHLEDNNSVPRGLAQSRFTRTLRAFQLRDLAHLFRLPHGANFSVPGAGKTAVTYALYEAERVAGRVDQLLIVAPLSAFETWQSETAVCFESVPRLGIYSGQLPQGVEVLLVNYQRLALGYDELAEWVSRQRTHVVLDEAHRMKRGRGGQWGSAALDLAFLAARRDILTGTPAPNAPIDLEALINFLWPNQARRVLPAETFLSSPPRDISERIASRIGPLFVRTTKRELELPPTEFTALEVPLEGLQEAIYRALIDRYSGFISVGRYDRLGFARLGRITMYLLEAATNPALLVAGSSRDDPIEFRHPPLEIPPDSRLSDLLRDYAQYETPRKFVELGRMIRNNAELGRKTLVWSNFVRNLTSLERLLATYSPAVVHGGVPSQLSNPSFAHTREDELQRFREDPDTWVLLANPAAVGEGISLHRTCHDAIYLDRTFNAGQYLQSLDRIHRLGLPPDQPTRFSLLLTEGTIDAVVDRRVRIKADALGRMLEDHDIVTMALPDEDDYGPVLDSSEDVAVLFAHLRGEDG